MTINISATKRLQVGTTIVGGPYVEVVESVFKFTCNIPGSADNLAKNIQDIHTANLKFFSSYSSGDINIYTNDPSTGSPDDSFLMKLDLPLIWGNSFSFEPVPIGTNITTLYFTNPATTAVTVKVVVGYTA